MSSSTSTYSVTDYLLDRANIHDTVTKLPWFYDTRSEAGLRDDVFAPEVHIDYTAVLGGEPSTVQGAEWAATVIRMVEHFDASQHVYGNLTIELPQPTTQSSTTTTTTQERPTRARVLVGQATASMVRASVAAAAAAAGAGGPGPLLQNGGRAIIHVSHSPTLDAKGLNPWRISSMALVMAWTSGNPAVMEGLE